MGTDRGSVLPFECLYRDGLVGGGHNIPMQVSLLGGTLLDSGNGGCSDGWEGWCHGRVLVLRYIGDDMGHFWVSREFDDDRGGCVLINGMLKL